MRGAGDTPAMERHQHHLLDEIRKKLLVMGAQVQDMLADAMRALVDRDDELGEGIAGRDEEIDQIETQVDAACHLAKGYTVEEPTMRI